MARVKLKDVIIRVNTKVDKDNTDLIYYVGGEHVESENIRVEKRGLIAGSTIGPMFYYGFKAGDFLLVSRNPHLKKAGLVDFDGICSEKTFVLATANPEVLLPEFLPFTLQNDRFWEYAYKNRHGSTNTFINWSTLSNYEFDLPDLDTQYKLAKILWSINNTREAYKKLITATDELVKSQFIERFGIPGTDPFEWGLTTLGECSEINPRRPRDMKTNADYSFVAMPSVSEDGRIDASIERPFSEVCKGFTYFAENDVLFAKITPCMENGKGGVAKGLKNKAGFGSTEFHVLRPLKGISDPYWLYIITMFPKFRSDAEKVMTGTGGQRRVPATYLSEYRIALPPIELQEQFAAYVQQSDKSKFELEQALSELTDMYKSIIKENLG